MLLWWKCPAIKAFVIAASFAQKPSSAVAGDYTSSIVHVKSDSLHTINWCMGEEVGYIDVCTSDSIEHFTLPKLSHSTGKNI